MDFIVRYGVVKTFGRNASPADELRSFTLRELDHLFSCQDLVGIRVRAKPGGYLHCRSKRIVIFFDRFTHAQTDTEVQRGRCILDIKGGKSSLDGDGALQSLVD